MRTMFFILAGYLTGSILFAYYLPLWIKQVDVTAVSDDGNPGTANAFKYAGIPVGILVILCELCKGFLPVFLAARQLDIRQFSFALVLAAPVAGHAFPAYTGGKRGGKAIAVAFGVLLGLLPDWTPVLILICCYLLFSLVIVIQPHLYRSVITFLVFDLITVFRVENKAVVAGAFLVSILVIAKHMQQKQKEPLKIMLLKR